MEVRSVSLSVRPSVSLSVSLCISTGQSLERTIVTQSAASCSSTSQTVVPSKTSTTGWRRLKATSSLTPLCFCWSATSVTWRPCGRSPGRRPKSWLGPSGCATWRPQRWTLSMWRRSDKNNNSYFMTLRSLWFENTK